LQIGNRKHKGQSAQDSDEQSNPAKIDTAHPATRMDLAESAGNARTDRVIRPSAAIRKPIAKPYPRAATKSLIQMD
jgi:hypothetical protein